MRSIVGRHWGPVDGGTRIGVDRLPMFLTILSIHTQNLRSDNRMAQMTERMKELFNKIRTVVLSTATPDGTPNAVPIGAKKILDDETILISDQFFNKTLANLKANPIAAHLRKLLVYRLREPSPSKRPVPAMRTPPGGSRTSAPRPDSR